MIYTSSVGFLSKSNHRSILVEKLRWVVTRKMYLKDFVVDTLFYNNVGTGDDDDDDDDDYYDEDQSWSYSKETYAEFESLLTQFITCTGDRVHKLMVVRLYTKDLERLQHILRLMPNITHFMGQVTDDDWQ